MTKLNLGAGTNYKEDYTNVDIIPNFKKDVNWDLNEFPYPWNDNSVDEVLMDNVLEHLDDQAKAIKEIHRILKPEGKFRLIYPFWNSIAGAGFQHKFVYSQIFINYFIRQEDRTKKTIKEYLGSSERFKLISERYIPNNSWFFRKISNYITSITKEIEWVMEK